MMSSIRYTDENDSGSKNLESQMYDELNPKRGRLIPNESKYGPKFAASGNELVGNIVKILLSETSQTIAVLLMLAIIISTFVQESVNIASKDIYSGAMVASANQKSFENIADLYTSIEKHDVPLLWTIDTRINSVVSDILVECFGAAQKESYTHGLGVEFTMLDFSHHKDPTETNANQSSQDAKMLVSSQLLELSNLFSTNAKGRLVSFMRHPVENVIKRHQFLTSRAVIPNLSFKHYLVSPYSIDNLMVRAITGVSNPKRRLNDTHLDIAKDFLRTKCLVGLYDQLEESLIRLEYLFLDTGIIKNKMDEEFRGSCSNKVMNIFKENDAELFSHYPSPTSPGWDFVASLHEYDVKLYHYAVELFRDQTDLMQKINREKPSKV